MLAVDTSPGSTEAAHTACALTPQATHIVGHVSVVPGETLLRMHGATEDHLAQLRQVSTDQIRAGIEQLAADLTPPARQVVLESGCPQTRLPDLIRHHTADRLSRAGHRIVAVDFDPQQVGANTRDGVTAVFGSAEDIHLLDALPLARARYVVSAIPTLDTNLALLYNLRHHDYHGTIALTAHTRHDADQLRAAGADTVLEPFATAANATTETLTELLAAGRDHDHDEPS